MPLMKLFKYRAYNSYFMVLGGDESESGVRKKYAKLALLLVRTQF